MPAASSVWRFWARPMTGAGRDFGPLRQSGGSLRTPDATHSWQRAAANEAPLAKAAREASRRVGHAVIVFLLFG